MLQFIPSILALIGLIALFIAYLRRILMAQIDELTAAVQANTDATTAAVAKLNLPAPTPPDLAPAIAQIQANTAALVAASAPATTA